MVTWAFGKLCAQLFYEFAYFRIEKLGGNPGLSVCSSLYCSFPLYECDPEVRGDVSVMDMERTFRQK